MLLFIAVFTFKQADVYDLCVCELHCRWYFRNIGNYRRGLRSWRGYWKSMALTGRRRLLLTSDTHSEENRRKNVICRDTEGAG